MQRVHLAARLGLDVRTLFQEELDYFRVTADGGPVQRRPAALIGLETHTATPTVLRGTAAALSVSYRARRTMLQNNQYNKTHARHRQSDKRTNENTNKNTDKNTDKGRAPCAPLTKSTWASFSMKYTHS